MTTGIILDDISYHATLFFLSRKEQNIKCISEKITKMIIFQKKLNYFHSSQNWLSVYNASNVNESYNNFVGIFLDIYSNYCPLLQCIINKNSKTWITNSLKILV